MEPRFSMGEVNPEAYEAMWGLERYLSTTRVDGSLKELIKIRASQINECAYCLDLHTRSAQEQGETFQRIFALNAWRESPFFTPEERAVLAFTEAVTKLSETHVPDEVYNEVRRLFDERQTAEILMQIVVINAWNRIGVATRLGACLVPFRDHQ